MLPSQSPPLKTDRPRHRWPLSRCFLVALTALCAATASADSIWQRRDPEHAYLFVDPQARRIGDLLTVIISQDTDVQNRDDRELNKTASASEAFSLAAQADGGFSQQGSSAALDFSNEADRSFQGGAAYSSERTFQDRFTVSVVDILPNGNLVISGKRRIWVSGDETVLVLTGVVRAIDVNAANSVPSHLVSDLHLSYESDGPERRFTRQGWLSRRFNRWSPF